MPIAQLKEIFIEANKPARESAHDWSTQMMHDHNALEALTRFEWLEALLRLVDARFNVRGGGDQQLDSDVAEGEEEDTDFPDRLTDVMTAVGVKKDGASGIQLPGEVRPVLGSFHNNIVGRVVGTPYPPHV